MTASNTGTSEFFIPGSRQAFINKVEAGLGQKKVVVIEGPTGIGKTTLLEEVLTQTQPNANKCYLTANKGINDIQVRSRIIEQLFGNVLFDPEMPLLTSFIEFSKPQQILIALDNSHFFSGRVVGELLQLSSEAANLGIDLTVVLALDKSLNSTLLNVNSKLIQLQTVPALSKQESYELLVEYIPDIPAQTNPKVKRWIDNAKGLPIQLLAYNEQDEQALDDDETPLNVKFWGWLLVLGSLALALGLYLYRQSLVVETPTQNTSVQTPKEQTVSEPIVVKDWSKEVNPALEPSTEQGQQPQSDFQLDEKPMARVTAMPTADSETILADILGETSAQPTQNKSITAQKVKQNDTTGLILSELSKEPEHEPEALVEQPVEVSDKPPTESRAEPEQKSDNSEQIANNYPEDELNPKLISSAVESVDTKSAYPAYFIDNQAFMSLPRDRFVLQLTAVSNQAVLSEYLASAPVAPEQLRIYQIKRKEKDWIVVTYGLFETIEQARAEAQRVEPNAWAKSISVIQQQILAFQKAQE